MFNPSVIICSLCAFIGDRSMKVRGIIQHTNNKLFSFDAEPPLAEETTTVLVTIAPEVTASTTEEPVEGMFCINADLFEYTCDCTYKINIFLVEQVSLFVIIVIFSCLYP